MTGEIRLAANKLAQPYAKKHWWKGVKIKSDEETKQPYLLAIVSNKCDVKIPKSINRIEVRVQIISI